MSDGMDYLEERVIPWVPLLKALVGILKMSNRQAKAELQRRKNPEHWLYGIPERKANRGEIYVNAEALVQRWNGLTQEPPVLRQAQR